MDNFVTSKFRKKGRIKYNTPLKISYVLSEIVKNMGELPQNSKVGDMYNTPLNTPGELSEIVRNFREISVIIHFFVLFFF